MITKKSITDLNKSLDSLDEILSLKDEIKLFSLGLKYDIIIYNDVIGSTFYSHHGKGSVVNIDIKYGRTRKPEYRIIVAYPDGEKIYQFNPDEFQNDRFSKIKINKFTLKRIKTALVKLQNKKFLSILKDLNFQSKGKDANLVYDCHRKLNSLNPDHFINKDKSIDTYYAYLFDYYSRYGIDNAAHSSQDLRNRKKILDFKKGKKDSDVVNKISKLLNTYFTADDLKDIILLPIPTSTNYKDRIRFKDFVKDVSDRTGIVNGYDLIKSTVDRPATHDRFNGSKYFSAADLKLSNYLIGRNVVLFDDIITTGNQFRQITNKVNSFGADVLMGIFLGQTVKVGK